MLHLTSSIAAVLAVAAVLPGPAAAAGPPPLSADHSRVDVGSSYGSGSFGKWGVDSRGLPRYRYEIDEETASQAVQPQLGGSRDAWSQLGNDHIVADAFNHGYVQLWSMDHRYQWVNYAEPGAGQYAGGYGYLNVDGRPATTLYDDRAPRQHVTRDFGLGYSGTRTSANGIEVHSRVYAPFGNAPLLLHDVVLKNRSDRAKRVSWFEYWGVNPFEPRTSHHVGVAGASYDAHRRVLSVRQTAGPTDPHPLSIFAAAIRGPVRGVQTDAQAFFGSGGRAAPDEVAGDHLPGTLAGPVPDGTAGHTAFIFRSPVKLEPGQKVTLRYAYGLAGGGDVNRLVDRYRAQPDPYARSASKWRDWLPQVDLGHSRAWLSRELEWDAYMVRSGATYESCAGRHIISQGGYYQYDTGFQGAYRDPLEHMLPMIYADPGLARDVLLYSAQEQPRQGFIPYGRLSGCRSLEPGTSDDLDLWLLLAASEYGLATRDTSLFRKQVRWSDSGSATLWTHLREAVDHQESLRGPHGLYVSGTIGDWSDFSAVTLGMTESTLVTAQAAFIYERLERLAELSGKDAFAARLAKLSKGLRAATRRQWVKRGWYTRGYTSSGPFGTGVIYGEPQPWAMLAGAPSKHQEGRLVGNIRRYLTGVGAPGGPSPIGSSQSPAADDPGLIETSCCESSGVGDGHAVLLGGSWFAVNGWLTWALGQAAGTVPNARSYAFDELQRNTLAAHAHAYPDNWDGVLSVDDACRSWYSAQPGLCGFGSAHRFDAQNMHQPAWSLFDTIKLAGIEPEAHGYSIDPRLPLKRFSLRLPEAGVAVAPGLIRGYVRVATGRALRMRVAVPHTRHVKVFAAGRRVAFDRAGGAVEFRLPVTRGRDANWAVALGRSR